MVTSSLLRVSAGLILEDCYSSAARLNTQHPQWTIPQLQYEPVLPGQEGLDLLQNRQENMRNRGRQEFENHFDGLE